MNPKASPPSSTQVSIVSHYYQRILCAIDLDDNSKKLLGTALAMVDGEASRLHVLHVCEHPITGYGELTGKNLQITETQIRQKAYPILCEHLKEAGIAPDHGRIEFGKPSEIIHKQAAKLNCDLIVVGSHGRSGLQLLLGSTSNSVLHGASCDVLTVRIDD